MSKKDIYDENGNIVRICNWRGCNKELVSGQKKYCAVCAKKVQTRRKISFIGGAIAAIVAAYVICPLDFDWIPGFGWIDDGIVTLGGIGGFINVLIKGLKKIKSITE